MRIRVGRTLRLVIALAFLVLMIPFLMFKLESANNESMSENIKLGYLEVNIKFFFFIQSLTLFIFYIG
jgi:hypothetical protein